MATSKQAKDITGVMNTPLTASELADMIGGQMPYFQKLYDSGKENELYMRGVNLNDQQKKVYHNKERGHYGQPITADKLARVSETQRNNKTSVKTEIADSFEGGDKAFPDVAFKHEIKSEIITMRCKKIEKDSGMEQLENQIFMSGIGAKYGIGEICVEHDVQGNAKILIRKRDYLDCFWDSNAKDYDKEDGKIFGHRKKVYRLDIRRDYGDKIANAISVNDVYYGRKANQIWGVQDKKGRRDYDVIYIYRMWIKNIRTTYHLIFGTDEFIYPTRKEAEQKERMLKLPYLIGDKQDQPIPKSDIVDYPDEVIDYYETTLNQILKYEQTELKFFPFGVYQSYYFEDEIWTLADLLKPNNKLMDKFIAQIDYAIGTDVKNGWELVVPWLADGGNNLPEAIRKVKAGEPLPVIRPGALKAIQQHGFNPQWLELLGVIRSLEDQYSGGDLYSGAQQGRQKESANAVAMKLQQQQLIAMLPISNLKYWKRLLFTKVIWFIKKYDTYQSIQKVHASELSKAMVTLLQENNIYSPSKAGKSFGYIEINNPENELTILQDAEVDVYVVEESLSSTQKLAHFQIMTQMEQADPELRLSPTWRKLKLQLMDEVSYEDREKITEEIQQNQQAQQAAAQQQQQQQMNIEKARVLAQTKSKGTV